MDDGSSNALVERIKIFVVDSHAVVCTGIIALLRGYPDFEVIGRAHNARETILACEQHTPDILTLDIDLPSNTHSIELIETLHRQHARLRIVVLTNLIDGVPIHKVLQAGATSYLLKNVSTEILVRAVRDAHLGRPTLSPEVMQILIHGLNAPAPADRLLTPREHQVLELIAQGRSNLAIAKELHISLSTVQFHVGNILTKLEAHNRTEAAMLVTQQARGTI